MEFSGHDLPKQWIYGTMVSDVSIQREHMNEQEVVEIVRKEAKRAGGVRPLAREWKVSPCYISDLMNGRRTPGPKILGPLGLERVARVTFEKRATIAQG